MTKTDEAKSTLRSRLARKQLVGIHTESWSGSTGSAASIVKATAKVGEKDQPAPRPKS